MGFFINGFISISIITTIGFIYGFFMFLNDYEANKCEMTYMFEYPQFVRISMDVDKYFKKYKLYAYSEGHLTERVRNMHFDGIPILFIPGNAGSHKQVRSLASVALRKSLNSHIPYHFDYFTIDTNEELSGFNGVLLNDQISYVNYSMHKILALYKGSQMIKPKSVVIIGHSMGGIIAKGLLNSLPDKSKLIPLVITLASPHKRLPVLFDVFAHDFYKDIKIHDRKSKNNVINIYGGYGDFMVTPNIVTGGKREINAVSTNVPKTWLPMDHLCILWCKQLVLVINRALFESVDPQTKQISDDYEYVNNVFKNHLIKNSGVKTSSLQRYDKPTPLEKNAEWVEYLQRQYVLNYPKGIDRHLYYMIRLVEHVEHEMLTVVGINLEVTDWIFTCATTSVEKNRRYCPDGVHLSHQSEIAPTKRYKRRELTVNLHELKYKHPSFTHVVVKILPTNEPVALNVDVYSKNARRLEFNIPQRISFNKQVLIEETVAGAVHYELVFPKLTHATQAYKLFVEPVRCTSEAHHSTGSLVSPWNDDQSHHYFTEIDTEPMDLRLFTSRPVRKGNETAYVKLSLDPSCRYKISVKSSIPMTLAQFARFYSPFLFAFVSSVTLLTFVYQLRQLGEKRRCPFFLTALKAGAKPYYFLPAVKIISQIASSQPIARYLPLPDWYHIQTEGIDFFLLPIVLFFVSAGIVWFLSIVLMVSLFLFESTLHKVTLRIIAKTLGNPIGWGDWILTAAQKFPSLVSVCLIVLSATTCGGLALCLGLIFYFLKLTQISQDVIEDVIKKLIKVLAKFFTKKTENRNVDPLPANGDGEPDEKRDEDKSLLSILMREVLENNEFFFHYTMFCLWFLVTCLNVPSVITWAHGFRFNPKLVVDPSLIPGVVLCVCSLPLWQSKFPRIERKGYTELSNLIYVLTITAVIYGTFSLFILNYVLVIIVMIVVLHQLLAPNRSNTREAISNEENDDDDVSFKNRKAKLE